MRPPSDAPFAREKIFNLPGEVTAALAALTAIQLVVGALPDGVAEEVVEALAFVPARISFALAPDAVLGAVADRLAPGVAPGDVAAAFRAAPIPWWSFVTYALLHANWTHLAVNGVTLAAFGSPLARRFGTGRFYGFLILTAVAGAAAHLAVHPLDFGPVIGASAAISGTMAASARFAFARHAEVGEAETGRVHAGRRLDLAELWSNRRALAFVALWFAVNLLFGLFPRAAGAGEQIAWEAHVGGFLAGLLLFGVFDRSREPEA